MFNFSKFEVVQTLEISLRILHQNYNNFANCCNKSNTTSNWHKPLNSREGEKKRGRRVKKCRLFIQMTFFPRQVEIPGEYISSHGYHMSVIHHGEAFKPDKNSASDGQTSSSHGWKARRRTALVSLSCSACTWGRRRFSWRRPNGKWTDHSGCRSSAVDDEAPTHGQQWNLVAIGDVTFISKRGSFWRGKLWRFIRLLRKESEGNFCREKCMRSVCNL